MSLPTCKETACIFSKTSFPFGGLTESSRIAKLWKPSNFQWDFLESVKVKCDQGLVFVATFSMRYSREVVGIGILNQGFVNTSATKNRGGTRGMDFSEDLHAVYFID